MKSPKRGEDAYGFAFVLSPVFCHSNQSDPLQLAPLTNFFDDWNKAGGNISETTITNTINSTKKFINEMLKKLCATSERSIPSSPIPQKYVEKILANLLYLQLFLTTFIKGSKESTHLTTHFGLNSDQQEKTDDVSEERCRLSLKQYMPDVLDRLFIIEQSHKYNLTAVREKIGQMTHYVLQGFQSMVEQVTWMSPKSRKAAEKKIKNLTVNLLHQKNATDDTTLLNTYNNLEFNPSWSLRIDESSMQQFAFQQTLESLLQTKFDREKLACDATDVNAFYAPEANSINIPLAILQPIVFSPTWPDEYIFWFYWVSSWARNNGGVNYDEEGYLNPWLEPQTQQAFDEMGKCLADEYSKFCNPKENRCLDGTYTLGENIADNAGET
uniref:Endothelin-converting enzyme 1 n=1 Tax=Ditylenchus dipsaci TaxID=166011 RepID=A0A915D449_9BILA